MQRRHLPDKGHPTPAALALGAGTCEKVETPENMRQSIVGTTYAMVAHDCRRRFLEARDASVVGGEGDGVIEQV